MDDFGIFLYNNWLLFLALVVILALLMRATLGRGAGGVGPQEATQLINHQNAVVLDVREPSEIENGTIRDARPIPLGELDGRLNELEKFKAKPIIVACRSGQRSSRACGILRKNGFENVHNLHGGIMAWTQAGLPLGKPKEKSGKKKGGMTMAHIEMYGTGFCPYCVRARLLLDKKEAEYEDIRIDREPSRRPEMEERANGATSVPQIFINGRHIGGCDELYELDYDGGLDPLLAD